MVTDHSDAISRRRWLAAAGPAGVLLAASRAIGRQDPEPPAPADSGDHREEVIRERAAAAGIRDLRTSEGERYVALASAPDDFVDGALRLCEGLATDYLGHFKAKGFAVDAPADRMTMVALRDQGEFSRFLGVETSPDVTGIYEIGPNYLVLYDGRTGGPAGAGAERANTITLFHEATHQLTFNTGLLDLEADYPLAVLEGLAMYGEVRRPDGRTGIGAVNRERLAVIAEELRKGGSLLPMADLLGDDGLFDADETVQLAYAQSWLFLYGFLREDRTADRLRAYLDALRGVEQRARPRLEVAREHLGDLDAFDGALPGFASRLIRGR